MGAGVLTLLAPILLPPRGSLALDVGVLRPLVTTSVAGVPAGALAYALAVALLVLAFGRVSGAHMNPAVTVALATANRFPAGEVLPYLAAQGVGGALAGATLWAAAAAVGRPRPALPATPLYGLYVVEWLLSFGLMIVLAAVAVDRRVSPRWAAATSGAGIAMATTLGLAAGGALLNPVRTLAYHLPGGALRVVSLYWLAPLTAMAAAVAVYDALRGHRAAHAVPPGVALGLAGIVPALGIGGAAPDEAIDGPGDRQGAGTGSARRGEP